MIVFSLTGKQIDLIADACVTVVEEYACFLDEEVRRCLADALCALGKSSEAAAIAPDP